MNILVTYASAHGSTAGIAERIAERLEHGGHRLVVRQASETTAADVAEADVVVIGSAIHSGQWLPEAERFLEAHAEALKGKPAWLFSVSSVGAEESFFPGPVARFMRRFVKESTAVRKARSAALVRDHAAFAGAIQTADWGRVGTLFLRALGGKTGDHRNWPAIERWAMGIAREFALKSPVAVR